MIIFDSMIPVRIGLFLSLCFLLVNMSLLGQSTQEIAGGRHGALSNSGVADQGVWQLFINPAGIIDGTSSWNVGASYTNRFLLSELSSRNLAVTAQLGNGRIGAVLNSFGYSSYRQNQISGVYALKLNDRLRAGIQLNYFSIAIAEGYGRFSTLSANLGAQYDFNDNVSIGLAIKNPSRSKLSSESDEFIQSIVSAGIKYKLSDNLIILSDLSKDLDLDPNFSLGIEYIPITDWSIRGGISTLNKNISFGFGYQTGSLSIDLASMFHSNLGFSPMISLTFKNE